jgi:imidazoleglycerol phosphate dehydratase HisB
MNAPITPNRIATIERNTRETEVSVVLNIDGRGDSDVRTGLGFLDHMLSCWCKHSGFDLQLRCKGDLQVDDHHTSEDCALTIGAALDEALGQRGGIARFGSAYAPLDEALARAVVDLSGRPWPAIDLGLRRERLGDLACESLSHVLRSLAMTTRCALHIDVLRGDNDHHRAEAAFKAYALAIRQATRRDPLREGSIASTKGVLS